MYTPEHFREERLEVLHAIIEENSFATLVTVTSEGPLATHIPILLDRTAGPLGTLRAHVARANPHWGHLESGGESLAIFLGDHAYVSPSWYATSGRVPTWNYVAVHAYGVPRLIDEATRVRALIDETVRRHESGFERPWDASVLDPKAVRGLLQGIVAFEIPITRLDGKRKLGQNRSRADREAMVVGLRRHSGPSGRAIANLVQEDLTAR